MSFNLELGERVFKSNSYYLGNFVYAAYVLSTGFTALDWSRVLGWEELWEAYDA